jgi:hypothetical protein
MRCIFSWSRREDERVVCAINIGCTKTTNKKPHGNMMNYSRVSHITGHDRIHALSHGLRQSFPILTANQALI